MDLGRLSQAVLVRPAPGRVFGVAGAALGALGAAAGAFGAHVLGESVDARALAVFETGVRYQMYHSLALLAVALTVERRYHPVLPWAGWSFVAGIVIFSGSLYGLALTGIGWLGAITPLGGVAFLVGWVCLLWGWSGSPRVTAE